MFALSLTRFCTITKISFSSVTLLGSFGGVVGIAWGEGWRDVRIVGVIGVLLIIDVFFDLL